MIINHNIAALNTYRQLENNNTLGSKSLEKLSSGLRVNRAGDDAAGLAISEKMRAQIRGLDQASRNAQDGISMIQTAEGALNEVHSMFQRMRELSVQASNSTLQAGDRTAIGDELIALRDEVNRIATATEFNGQKLLNGSLVAQYDAAASGLKLGAIVTAGANVTNIDLSQAVGGAAALAYTFTNVGAAATLTGNGMTQTLTVADMAINTKQTLNFSQLGIKIEFTTSAAATGANIAGGLTTAANVKTVAGTGSAQFQIGANAGQNVTVAFANMKLDTVGNGANAAFAALFAALPDNQAVSDTVKASSLITLVEAAITQVSGQRGNFGAAQNRLEHTIANLDTTSENMTASESRIRDVDMAKEMMTYTKMSILQQAAQAMLAQANQQPQGVLQLLK